jgi:hypothetical protein
MKTISLALVGVTLILCAAFFSLFPDLNRICLVIGGSHTLHAGQSVEGTLVVIFAQVIIYPDARLGNGLVAISSDVAVDGTVSGGVYSLESDVSLGEQAVLASTYRQMDLLNTVILLPEIYTAAVLGE